MQVFEKNRLDDPLITDSVRWHHAPMFEDEGRCYPVDVQADKIPPYVKVCKLADVYDALTSVRCYKKAFNPIEVITDLFGKYLKKMQNGAKGSSFLYQCGGDIPAGKCGVFKQRPDGVYYRLQRSDRIGLQ